MAFYINDSANTSHPLMDAIVKYSKIILDDMILKNEEVANNYETADSMETSDYFMAVKNGSMRLGFFPAPLLFNYLQEYGYSAGLAFDFVENPDTIPLEERDNILAFCNECFLRDYEEQNLYYRRLAGLPPFGTDEFDIYIDYETYGPYLDLDDAHTDFDFSRPIHQYSVTEITTLETIGVMDLLYEKYIDNNEDLENREGYKYLRFLGGRKVDIYTARIANNWDILYMPPADIYVTKRFRELYAVNREVYERKIDQLAYSVRSDHFQEMVMFMIVCQTFNDMIVDTPEWYIRRDIIDLRSVQYFLESQGVKFFEDIPMRFQIRIVKNLNRLIRFKSTDKNIADILEIFASEDTQIYQYYLLKKYKTTDLKSHTITGFPPLPEEWQMETYYDFEEDTEDSERTPVEDEYEFDFQDFDDPLYVPDDTVLYMYDYESEETPNILAWQTLPVNEDGDHELDCWYEDYELHHGGDEDHTRYVNHTADLYGNDKTGLDPIGEEYVTYDFGMESATSELDELAEFDMYIYDFGWEEAHIVEDYKVTEARTEYEQSTCIIKDQYGNIYDLEFIKVPIDDQYDNYIKDKLYRVDYDEITLDDKYWDGEDTHSYVRNQHLQTSYYDNGVYRDHDFTIEGTKFMGLEYNVSLSQYSYEQNYYLGMILNTKIDVSEINIGIPSIRQNSYFNIRNIILFLYCCNGLYTGEDIDVNDPSHAVMKRDTELIPDFEPYIDIDGGYVWSGDGDENYNPEEEWEVPNIDFETFDPEDENVLRELVDCGNEEDYVYFELEFDGEVLDYLAEEYYVIPGHMDHEYDYGAEEDYPNQIMPMTGAQVYDFDYDDQYPPEDKRDYSNLWEFGDDDGYELFENYQTQLDEWYQEIEENNKQHEAVDEIVEGDDEDIPKDEYYDYNYKVDMEFGDEDLEEYIQNTAIDYNSYIFPYDDVSNDPMFRENLLIDGRDEDELRARVQDELSEMGDEDYVIFKDLDHEGQNFKDGSYDFAFYDELHPVGDKPLPSSIPEFWYEVGEDECGNESPPDKQEIYDIEDAIFGDEDDSDSDEYANSLYEGPCEDDAHPADLTALCDYGCEDDGTYIKFIGEDYDCGNEEEVEGLLDMSTAIEIDCDDFQIDRENPTEEQLDIYYKGIYCGDEDNSELEPVPAWVLVEVKDKVNGYDREDEDVMHRVYDFGYHYELDPLDYLYDYDYGEITKTSIDSDELLWAELNEKDPYFHNMDFGYEDKDNLFYSEYTKVYEMGDSAAADEEGDGSYYDGKSYDMGEIQESGGEIIDTEFDFDFKEIDDWTDDGIGWKIYDFGYFPDSWENYQYDGFYNEGGNVIYASRKAEVAYSLGDNDRDYIYLLSDDEYDDIWDCGEITEDSDDTIEPDDVEYDDGIFRFYTDERWYHELRITKDNYMSIVGQLYINQRNGDLYKITPERAESYIGRYISYLDWWWNKSNHGYFEKDYDGHSPGELDLVISYDNYEMIIGQQYVDPQTGNIEIITREKAYSYTYSDYVFLIDEENKEQFLHSKYQDWSTLEFVELTWDNLDEVVEKANRYYDGKITIRVNKDNFKKFIGLTYIDSETQDETEFTLYIGKHATQTNVGILDWYWNTDDRGWLETYYLNADGGRIPYSLITKSSFYDYIRTDHTLMYKDCMGRIYGFNMAVELEQLEDDINFNHSTFGFQRAYTLKDFGCDTYIVQRKFSNLKELYNVYINNTKCYNTLKTMYENAGTRDEKRVMEYVFYTLFTRPYDMEFYIINNGDIATTYDQVLQKHDFTLYSKYLELQAEVNATTRIYNVRNIMNDLVDSLNYYMNGDTIKYALSFIYTCSFDAMLNYIQEMIDFFKSWKVQFVNRKINYLLDDKMNNTAIYGDQLGEIRNKYYGAANGYMADAVKIHTLYFSEDNIDKTKVNFGAEVIDLAAIYMNDDIFMDRDYDGCNHTARDETVEALYPGEVCLDLDGGGFSNRDDEIVADVEEFYHLQLNGGRVDRHKELHDLDGGRVKDIKDYVFIDDTAILALPQEYQDYYNNYIVTHDFENRDFEYEYQMIKLLEVERRKDMPDVNSMNEGIYGYCDIDGGNFTDKYIGYDPMIGGYNNPELGIARKPYDFSAPDLSPDYQELKGYDVNGGIPNIHAVYTQTAVTKISDFNEVSVDVRLAPIESNGLEVVYTEDGEPPVWPMRNIDFGFEDQPDDIFDYGDLDNPGDTFIIGKRDIYGNDDEEINSTENSMEGLDDYANENDEYYLLDIDTDPAIRIFDYGNLDDSNDEFDYIQDVYGNEDASPNAAENIISGLDDYQNLEDDYTYLLQYIDNRRSKNIRIYEFGDEDINDDGFITERKTEGTLLYDYGEIQSGTKPEEDFVESDAGFKSVGLYFDYTKYAPDTEITRNTESIIGYGETNAKELKAMINDMTIFRNRDTIERYIQSIFNSKLESMVYILNKFSAGDDAYVASTVYYQDDFYRNGLYNWWNDIDPYCWTDFEGNKIRQAQS